MTSPVKTAIFDLDGTITDSLPLIYAGFHAATEPVLGRLLTEREIRERFGPPDHEIIRSFVGDKHAPAAIERYLAVYEADADGLESAHVGMDDVVRACKDAGIRVGLVTGKSRRTALVTLGRLGLDGWYDVLVAGDDVVRPKPHPEGTLKALATVEHQDGDSGVFIGDSAADMLAGRASGLVTVGVLWGAPDHEELLGAEPDVVCTSADDVLRALGLLP